MSGKRLIGLGTLARELGTRSGTLRYHLLTGNIPDPSRRAPNGSRVFDEPAAEIVRAAWRDCRFEKNRGRGAKTVGVSND